MQRRFLATARSVQRAETMSALSVNTTATDPDIEGMRLRWALIWYLAVLPALWIAPPVFTCCRRRLRFRRGAREHSPAPNVDDDTRTSILGVTTAQLEAAEQARKRLQVRVKGTLWQVGYMLVIYSLICLAAVSAVRRGAPDYVDPTPIVGSYALHCWANPVGFAMLLLSVHPSEAARIRVVLKCSTIMGSCGTLFVIGSVLSFYNAGRTEYATSLLFVLAPCAGWMVSSAHSLYGHLCFRSEPVPPRRQLQRLWRGVYGFFVTFSIIMLCTGIFRWLCSGSECDIPPFDHTFAGAFGVLCCLATTPANRGRITRWLGSLGSNGPAEQQAASVATLLGDTSVVKALADAINCFRAQPVSTITRVALVSNDPDPSLHALTVPAKLGAVDAFVSHSWCMLRRSNQRTPAVPRTGASHPRVDSHGVRDAGATTAASSTTSCGSGHTSSMVTTIRSCGWTRAASTSSTSTPAFRAFRSSYRAASSS